MFKNFLMYVAVLAGTLCLAVWKSEYYAIAAFILVLIVPLILMSLNIYIAKNLEVRFQKKSVLVQSDENVGCRFVIENKSIFPVGRISIDIEMSDIVGNRGQYKLYTNVLARDTKELVIYFRGESPIGGKIQILSAKSYDYLCMTCKRVQAGKEDTTLEYGILPEPHICNVNLYPKPDAALEENDRFSEIKPGTDRTEVFGIREYVPGDSIRDIHWNLSNKKDELIVKEFSLPLRKELKIIIDPYIGVGDILPYSRMGTLCRYIRALYETLEENGIGFSIILFNSENGQYSIFDQGYSSEQYMAMMGSMYRNIPTLRAENFATKTLDENDFEGDIIYISANIDKRFIDYIKNLNIVGQVTTVLIDDGYRFEQSCDIRVDIKQDIEAAPFISVEV